MLLLGALTAVWFAVKRRDFVPAVLIVGWGHLALFAARNIPLFAIVSAPFVAQALQEMLCSLEGGPVADWLRAIPHRIQKHRRRSFKKRTAYGGCMR